MTTIASTSLLSRNPDLIAANIDGDVVMMGVDQGEYYGITGVGSRAWELLATPTSIDDISDVICQEYQIDKDTCRKDITVFVTELVELKMVSVVK